MSVESAELARNINLKVFEIGQVFEPVLGDDYPLQFICECGCLDLVEMTMADYDLAGGARSPEHRKARRGAVRLDGNTKPS